VPARWPGYRWPAIIGECWRTPRRFTDGQVRTAIDQAMTAAGKRPRDLWHVVLFYVAGELTRQTLAARGIEYQPYVYANNLFKNAWPAFQGPVEQAVRPFVDRQTNLAEMVKALAAAAP
jgi:hypothetical protein